MLILADHISGFFKSDSRNFKDENLGKYLLRMFEAFSVFIESFLGFLDVLEYRSIYLRGI